jgi:hypothetical protein
MSMNVMASGERANGETFKFWTKTVSVSQYGGVLMAEKYLQEGERVQLTNEFNRKKALGRIISVRKERDGHYCAAFEFVQGEENFWSMVFPRAGAKPMRRVAARRASGE